MKNNLTALNNYLFETLERLTDDSLTDEQLQREITRSQAVAHIAETAIRNGDLALRSVIAAEDCGFRAGAKRQTLPKMLEAD